MPPDTARPEPFMPLPLATPAPNHPMSREAAFRWHIKSQVHIGAQKVDLASSPVAASGDPGRTVAQTLRALHAGLQDTAQIRVSPQGVECFPAPAPTLHCMTSGSSGAAKTIRRSHASWIASFNINREIFVLTPTDRYAVLGRLENSLGLYALLEALHIGADVHLLADHRPARQMRIISEAGVTLIYATPTQLRLLLRAEAPPPRGVRHILCGGGVLDEPLRAEIHRALPDAQLHEFYGASETSFITLSRPQTPRGSVGRAYGAVDIKIDAVEGETGEIWVKSPYLFEGYASGESPLTRWRDGYLSVGEMGWRDPQGNLYLSGRKNRMVLIADQNVFPEDIERFFLALPHITHCAVLPVSDGLRGSHLVAVVDGAPDPALADAWLAQARVAFGPLIAPKRLIALPDFPCLGAGKPDLVRLAQIVAQETPASVSRECQP